MARVISLGMHSNSNQTMQITIQLDQTLARRVGSEGASAIVSTALGQLTAKLGIEAKPLHPGEADPALACFFWIDVADRAAAEQLVARLLATPGIEAAYFKPADEAPAGSHPQ